MLRRKRKKNFLDENPDVLDAFKKITSGSYKIQETTRDMIFCPNAIKDENVELRIGESSTSVRSLLMIWYWLHFMAQRNQILMIDEPELNLHPNKQRQIAKLLIQLVNAGIKILITTHSDYLVREINNRIMLNNIPTKDSGKIMKEFKIDDSELLNIQQVRAFGIDDERKITSYTVDEYGIDTRIFDKVINEANILNDKIFYSLDAEK